MTERENKIVQVITEAIKTLTEEQQSDTSLLSRGRRPWLLPCGLPASHGQLMDETTALKGG